jgi:hypothetical protein
MEEEYEALLSYNT